MDAAEKIIYTEELYSIQPLPTVVITKPWPEVKDDEKEQLIKILSALKLPIERVTIKFQPAFDLSGWKEKPDKLIYFGSLPAGIAYYEVIDVNGVSLVASESLEALLADEPARKRLWGALRQLFSI
jgi:hypothetical protein